MTELATKADLREPKADNKADLRELELRLVRFLFLHAVGIVGLSVTLILLVV